MKTTDNQSSDLAKAVEDILLNTKSVNSDQNILEKGIVSALNISQNSVRFVLDVTQDEVEAYKPIRAALENQIKALEGAEMVMVGLSAQAAQTSKPAEKDVPKISTKGNLPPQEPIKGVKHVICVGSGKGGVGKSTLSVNLALALAKSGLKIGLLDADVFGPSQTKMLGVHQRPETSKDGKTIIPIEQHGLKLMSMGLMVEDGQAIVWRGPMLMGALTQMLHQVAWGELDILIIDLPPGTGDVQLSLAQKTVVRGALIISTPQDVALIDARRAVDMFNRLNVPILGMVENMSTHICSNCGHEEAIFGHEGVKKEAEKLGVPLLGQVPLHLKIREAGDNGLPMFAQDPEDRNSQVFNDIAAAIKDSLINR